MSKWGKWLKRPALALLGAVLIGGSAGSGVPVLAADMSTETGTPEESTRTTVMSFKELAKEESVRHVEPGCTEEEVLSQLPAELEALAVIRAPQDTFQSNADTENEGTDEQMSDADNTADTTQVLDLGKKFLEAGENYVLEQTSTMVPVTWKLDVESGYSSSGAFDSVDGTKYAYVPVVADTDGNGNLYTADAALYKSAEELPSMHVLVLNQAEGSDSSANDVSTIADDDTSGNEMWASDKTHGLVVSTEIQNGDNVTFDTDNNFVIKTGGTYTVSGAWERIYDDKNDVWITAGSAPVITIVGPGTFSIVLADDLKLDTTSNGAAKPLIKVTGNANVELLSNGGSMTCQDMGDSAYAALMVQSGSTVEIGNGGGRDFEIAGQIWNEGTLTVKKNVGTVKVDGSVVNAGKMQVGIFDEKATAGGTAGVWFPGKLDISANGYFINMARGELTIGNESTLTVDGSSTQGNGFANSGSLKVSGKGSNLTVTGSPFKNESKIVIEGDTEGKGQLTANRSFSNTGEIDVEKKGILQVGGMLTNSNRLSVKAWTIPEPVSDKDDGGQLIANSTADGIVNTGTLEFGEGGLLGSTAGSSVTVTNSGTFRIADPKFVADNIQLAIPAGAEESAKFYLTNITDEMIADPPKIAYTGDNQYQEVWDQCDYQRTWPWIRDSSIKFEVVGSDWEHDIFLDEDGTTSADRTVQIPQDYWIVYYAKRGSQPTRRNSPVSKSFTMAPASVSIKCTNASTTASDHPDLIDRLNPEKGDLTEEQIKDSVYELGADIKLEITMAVYSQVKSSPHIENALKIKVQSEDGSDTLVDVNDGLLDGTSDAASYRIPFDSLGRATITIKDIPTLPENTGFIKPGTYNINIEADSVPDIDAEERTILEALKNIYVVRARTIVNLDNYSFQYTYGDKIPNPVEGDTLKLEGTMGSVTIQYDWYRTKNKEDVEDEDSNISSLGGTFPSKETLSGNIGSGWDGSVAGDYVLKVSVRGSVYSTGGVGYKEINVARKDVTIKIPNEPHKTYGTKDEDAPIDYQVTGLVKWPLEPKEGEEQVEDELAGSLTRERDKTNLVDGVQGPDEWDKVGSYIIEKGTLDEERNPNYKITLDGNYVYTIDPKTLTWGMTNLIVAQQDNRYKVYGGLTLNDVLEPDIGKVGVTYEKLVINEDGTILEVVEPKIININDAVDTNYALNYNPPASNEISIRDSIYRLQVTEGGTQHLSNALQELSKTTIGIDGEMSTAVKALRAEELNYKADDQFRIYDVAVYDKNNAEKPVEDIFQKGGLIVTIPYPEGTSSTTHKFVATHMITSKIDGAKSPGTIERFAGSEDRGDLYKLEQTAEGITIKVTGLSPIAIAWAPINSSNPNNPGDANNPNDPNGGNSGTNDGNGSGNGTNDGNGSGNGTNDGNGSGNGTNDGNGSGSGTNGTNNGTNSGTNGTTNGTNNNNKTTTGTTSTTKATSAKTGDTAQIAFYMIATLVACLLLILIIVLMRLQFRKKE